MSYTHTTLGDFKTALANRLGDTGKVYWVDAELGYYCIEALQTWGLMTGYWRDTGQFPTVASTAFYNINTLQNGSSESLLTYTVTDKTLSTVMQYHLLEPATGSTWTGSEQFTLADVVNALEQRRDALLSETGAVVTYTSQAIGANTKFLDLPEETLSIRRMGWLGTSSGSWPIFPDDISNQRNYRSGYLTTPSIPETYAAETSKQLRCVLAPPTNEPGTLTTLTVRQGANLDASGIALGIPDDMAWIVKWGALADMLGREGPGQDLTRAYFCERRYRLGIELAKVNATVINAQINGVDTSTDSITKIDQYMPNWEASTGSPTFIGNLRNYVSIATCPDGIYSVLLDVVRKAIVPSTTSDDTHMIQISKDYINPMLDYAEHLAAFKCGGVEFRQTFRGADNFFTAALLYNQKVSAKISNITELIRQSTTDDYIQPMVRTAANPPLQREANSSAQSEQMKRLYGNG